MSEKLLKTGPDATKFTTTTTRAAEGILGKWLHKSTLIMVNAESDKIS